MDNNKDYKRELVNVFAMIGSNKKLLNDFLGDLFSPREYTDMAKRWQIVKMLDGEATQREIAREVQTTVATINRGAHMLSNPSGGFNQVLRKF